MKQKLFFALAVILVWILKYSNKNVEFFISMIEEAQKKSRFSYS